MNSIFPWQHEQWTLLRTRAAQRQLAHGLLFAGPAGTGKSIFAETFARSLLCRRATAEGLPCGSCDACLLLEAGTHPDFLRVAPPEDKTQILIDQIRELCRGLGLKSHAGGYKVAILSPAEQMNTAAANSLLKTLEEPTDNTVLILIAEQPARLPATIRSRCQQLRFPAPAREEGRAWLEIQLGTDAAEAELLLRLAEGAPLQALVLGQRGTLKERHGWLDQLIALRKGQQDPVRVAAEWAEDAELRPLFWFGSFLADLVRLHQGDTVSIKNRDLLDKLNVLLAILSTTESHSLLNRIWRDYRLAQHTSVNRPLLMEDVLIGWTRGGQRRRAMV